MAGPGGGPPRRSHTKSRKGCETCKRRHIRCDETFPQCRNCTKHKIRCPYNDIPMSDERSGSPDQPDLMWTPEYKAVIEQWQNTGVFPFPGMNIYPTPNPQYLSTEDLRLIHHVASISDQMLSMDADGFTLWTRQIPTLIKIGATTPYVMHALLAFSAMHIAFLTDCPLVGNMAYEHRGIALKGLQEAIGTFSRETSDAILAASLVLSWQATDWRSWTHLMQGTRVVMEAMEPWKHESQFGDFIAESSTFPTAPPSPTPDHKPSQPHQEDIDAFQRTLQQLQKLESHMKQIREDPKAVTQLITFLKGARKVSPAFNVAQQFERLRDLRTWLFWLPVDFLQRQRVPTASSLLIIAHYYTVALIMERLFPEIGAAYFGSMSIAPVEEIARRLLSVNVSGNMNDVSSPLPLMEFPIDMVKEFRSRMGFAHPVRTPSFPQFDPPNFYVPHSAPMQQMPVTTAEYGPYGTTPAFSYSTEDLSVITADHLNTPVTGPTSAISPLQLSSPFTNHQYLNIPSPSYGGYSPASSTFGGDFNDFSAEFGDNSSIGYSDHEDFAYNDMGFGTPMIGGSSNFGAGTPTCMSTTPTFPPPEDPLGRFPGLAPSPFLKPEQFGMLPPPESPIPGLSVPNHRHNLSVTSIASFASAPPSLSDYSVDFSPVAIKQESREV
ncbi:hypothetical protein MCOR02_004175 [Pyricularia oryzae]|uniref:Zn(2)-C6 fungal-type domain-containing protein n=1 Tax=Pyricularia oryzae TaxID=318829 RepID=A0A4P7MZ99_PYROR|nr:hypothetical protein MCOR02_004175 [Pyricularia oryzae]KAI6328156.1 hypothetical protein MCOR34_000302 [Pyricularia oryzae]KAI6454744.1 hypothetical protein MCOR17_008926 [Pyricularia oryzae]KAI6480334.1 hypothetical protein MCOR13_011146 [Pyricularia oryzae]KAI6596756.1 hypothetical protein MCOR04_002877 [Pyricularia oryzae]